VKGGDFMTPEILTIAALIAVPALVWAWKQFAKPLFEKAAQIELVKAVVEGLADGELTEAEARRIVEEIKALLSKED
jgi:hypothetical protein